MIMTQPATAVNEHESGYSLYCANRPLHACASIDQARGWLEAQWQEGAAEAEQWNVRYTEPHPRHLTDADVEGAITQADHLAEVAYWEDRRRGY